MLPGSSGPPAGQLGKSDAHSDGDDAVVELAKLTGGGSSASSSKSAASLPDLEKASGRGSPKAAKEPEIFGLPLKWISLASLTLQTSAQALLIKWSKSGDASGVPYVSSTVVFFTEFTKLCASLALVIYESEDLTSAFDALRSHFTQSPADLMKAAVPSLIYTFQNNLMFYSFDKLSAPVQQVLYQMKIITTAGISVVFLGTKLSPVKWIACFELAAGVALVQWPRNASGKLQGDPGEQLLGFLAVFMACCTSGFAGVWIQKMLQQSSVSVWIRNVQLALFGSLTSAVVAFSRDGAKIMEGGFTQGYNGRVLAVILMTAFGGLLCAVMLKYAGATYGCFSTALSIILTTVLSHLLVGDFEPDTFFYIGTAMAIGASLLFALGLPNDVVEFFQTHMRKRTRTFP